MTIFSMVLVWVNKKAEVLASLDIQVAGCTDMVVVVGQKTLKEM